MGSVLRNIPSVNELLESPPLKRLMSRANRTVVVTGIRSFLDTFRADIQSTTAEMRVPTPSELAERIADWILREEQPALRPVINATGILLHTGLGRAPLAAPALDAIRDIASGYASLEIDLESGQRSHRIQAVERLLRKLTGAEAAVVVNNNAGATLLTLAAVAAGKEVIVSRGQLIEIGGSYRLPDVMSAGGAILREVGTTNKTRIADYRDAIHADTAALMRVHTSNYVVEGFAESASLAELVHLARSRNLPLIDDIGSGALLDFAKYGVSDEPVASHSIQAGADLVLFSGDKLLGGPQCGIIVGKKNLVDRISKHPLMRALRVGKLTLAALAATLQAYTDIEVAEQTVPLLQLLSTSIENLKNRAQRLATQLATCPLVEQAEPLADTTFLGGGSVPSQSLPTWTVAIAPRHGGAEQLARQLRTQAPAILARIHKGRVVLDLRSVFAHQDGTMVAAFENLSVNQPQPAESHSETSPTGENEIKKLE